MTTSLQFPLEIEDQWPPVGSESLPFDRVERGYEAMIPPLFVRDLSVGDIIDVCLNDLGFVSRWWHVRKSVRSVVWLLRLSDTKEIEPRLEKLRAIGCNTTGLREFGCYSVDVPEGVAMDAVDEILGDFDTEEVALAFPSFRHTG